MRNSDSTSHRLSLILAALAPPGLWVFLLLLVLFVFPGNDFEPVVVLVLPFSIKNELALIAPPFVLLAIGSISAGMGIRAGHILRRCLMLLVITLVATAPIALLMRKFGTIPNRGHLYPWFVAVWALYGGCFWVLLDIWKARSMNWRERRRSRRRGPDA